MDFASTCFDFLELLHYQFFCLFSKVEGILQDTLLGLYFNLYNVSPVNT